MTLHRDVVGTDQKQIRIIPYPDGESHPARIRRKGHCMAGAPRRGRESGPEYPARKTGCALRAAADTAHEKKLENGRFLWYNYRPLSERRFAEWRCSSVG
jgi:hypothetical protein